MKSIITLFGAFLFAVFLEGFIRIIITFYHQVPFSLFGISTLPGASWIAILFVAVFIIYWISSMLVVTITNFSPGKHLVAFATLALVWRLNEFLQMREDVHLLYSASITFVILLSIILAYFIKKNLHATPST